MKRCFRDKQLAADCGYAKGKSIHCSRCVGEMVFGNVLVLAISAILYQVGLIRNERSF